MRGKARSARVAAACALVVLGFFAVSSRPRGASGQTSSPTGVSSASNPPSPAIESLVTLQWIALPESCPDAAFVYAEIARLLGSTKATSEDTHVSGRARVEPTADGFRVELSTVVAGTKGARTFDAQTCRGAANATALIVALMVNPGRVGMGETGSGSETESVTVPTTGSATGPATGSATATAPAPTLAPALAPTPAPALAAAPPLFSLSSSLLLDAGTFPSASLGATYSLAVFLGRTRIELAATYLPKARSTIGEAGAGATFWSAGGEARFGWDLVRARWFSLSPLVGLEVAHVHASSFGVTDPKAGGTFRVAGTLALLGLLPLSREVAVRALVTGLVPIGRPDFGIEGVGIVHREPIVAFRATLGLELWF